MRRNHLLSEPRSTNAYDLLCRVTAAASDCGTLRATPNSELKGRRTACAYVMSRRHVPAFRMCHLHGPTAEFAAMHLSRHLPNHPPSRPARPGADSKQTAP